MNNLVMRGMKIINDRNEIGKLGKWKDGKWLRDLK